MRQSLVSQRPRLSISPSTGFTPACSGRMKIAISRATRCWRALTGARKTTGRLCEAAASLTILFVWTFPTQGLSHSLRPVSRPGASSGRDTGLAAFSQTSCRRVRMWSGFRSLRPHTSSRSRKPLFTVWRRSHRAEFFRPYAFSGEREKFLGFQPFESPCLPRLASASGAQLPPNAHGREGILCCPMSVVLVCKPRG